MTDVQASQDTSTEQTETSDAAKKADPAMVWTKRLLIACAVIWVWHLFADRLTPYSEHTRVRTFITPIVPQVSGRVTDIGVDFNQYVEGGDLLFKIDPSDYQLALEQAQANFDQSVQNVGASSDDIVGAEAKLTQTETYLAYAETEARRYKVLAEKGVISASERDRVEAEVKRAQADVAKAQADVTKANTRLGQEGENNPRVRKAYSQLRRASLDLARTEVRAPSKGGVINAVFSEGQYATAGQPLMTFVDTRLVWLESYIRENSLGNIKPGDDVEIALDKAPGRVFKGTVASITPGVSWNQSGQTASALPTISVKEGWLRESQRFPVTINFVGEAPKGYLLEGGQADVIIYTGGNVVLNAIAWLQIRVMSLLSYLY